MQFNYLLKSLKVGIDFEIPDDKIYSSQDVAEYCKTVLKGIDNHIDGRFEVRG